MSTARTNRPDHDTAVQTLDAAIDAIKALHPDFAKIGWHMTNEEFHPDGDMWDEVLLTGPQFAGSSTVSRWIDAPYGISQVLFAITDASPALAETLAILGLFDPEQGEITLRTEVPL